MDSDPNLQRDGEHGLENGDEMNAEQSSQPSARNRGPEPHSTRDVVLQAPVADSRSPRPIVIPLDIRRQQAEERFVPPK